MTNARLKLYALAVACCFALILVPVRASAQLGGVVNGAKEGVEKGAQGVQKGAEGTYNTTKKAITGEDNNTNTENQMKPGQTQENESQTTQSQSNTSSESTTGQTSGKHMPRTAGELPLLALAGCLALAAAGTTRRFRRQS